MSRPTARAPRSDARQNRARIVETAQAAFTDDPSASLQAIAKAAGVGQGTMYRHFPSREALLLTVYREELDSLAAAAPRLLREHEPLEALRLWFEHLCLRGQVTRGASLAVDAATRAGRYHPPIVAAVNLLLGAGKEARQIRPDAEADDVLLLGSSLWRADGAAACQESSRRVLTVIIDGLRADTRT
ncbi:TetR/AcrR family transcriptional regulator [Streptomyces sp. CWNU-52B]|uniref:TetR/AcrR family transcriptional regulator n=1 Tax=unclassified Streptomyces TaxID=2593676 RepID=UPI0039BFD203